MLIYTEVKVLSDTTLTLPAMSNNLLCSREYPCISASNVTLTMASSHPTTGGSNLTAKSPTSVTSVTKQKVDADGNPLLAIHKRTYQACVGPSIRICWQNTELILFRFHVGAEKYAVTWVLSIIRTSLPVLDVEGKAKSATSPLRGASAG